MNAAVTRALSVSETPAAVVRQLSTGDRPAILTHLLALNRDDRYGRFASVLGDTAIAAYVERLHFARDAGFGILDAEAQLLGFLHLVVHAPSGEIGASVLPHCRRCGLARQLFAAAFAHASACGVKTIHLATGHPAALRICASLGHPILLRPTAPRALVGTKATATHIPAA